MRSCSFDGFHIVDKQGIVRDIEIKGLKSVIGPSEIRLATAKQLGIEIVDELIDMEGDVLDRPGDYLIPLKLEDTRSSTRPKLNVRIAE